MVSPRKGKERALEDNSYVLPTQATYRHLLSESNGAANNPLRCIAHIDIDAAYAAMEMARLGLPSSIPLAVRQWNGLIAVNYAARAFGITRHESPIEAVKKCPALVMVHVATYRGGDTEPGYWEGDDVLPTTHKVSLDPYRRESLKIIKVFSEFCSIVEKASIDESYLDLSQIVKNQICTSYPALSKLPPGLTNDSLLPSPASLGITVDWSTVGNVIPTHPNEDEVAATTSSDELGSSESSSAAQRRLVDDETAELTWSDVALSIGAAVVRDCRSAVEARLGYTCSAGIAPNKTLAKLCSAWKKPNAQTILRVSAVPAFLRPMHFTKIRGFGGKLGAQITEAFKAETVEDLLVHTIGDLQDALGEGAGLFVWEIARGIDEAEVAAKTQVKSMLSSKNFKPSINTFTEASHWLGILATELHLRLSESREGDLGLWPKTISFAHRSDSYVSRSHQVAFPYTSNLSIAYIVKHAEKLLRVAVTSSRSASSDNKVIKWDATTRIGPYSNMQLTFSGLEKMESGQSGIESFFAVGVSAANGKRKAAATAAEAESEEVSKRKRENRKEGEVDLSRSFDVDGDCSLITNSDVIDLNTSVHRQSRSRSVASPPRSLTPPPMYVCDRCSAQLLVSLRHEHDDYHFARDMFDEQKANASVPTTKAKKTGSTSNPSVTGTDVARSGSSTSNRGKLKSGSKAKASEGKNTIMGFFGKKA